MSNENKLWVSEATRPVMEGNVQYHIRCGEGDIERYCLLPGDPARCNMIAETWDSSRFVADYREHRTFSGEIGGAKISCCSTGAGSGSSNLYVDMAYPAVGDYMVTAALIEAAEQLGFPYHVGYSCSTGSWYCGQGRPGFGGYTQSFIETKVEDLRRARVLNFEMETSCLFTLCGLYGLRGGSVCTAFANRNKDKFAYGGMERSIQVANLAVQILHDWDQKMEAAGKKHWYPGLLK